MRLLFIVLVLLTPGCERIPQPVPAQAQTSTSCEHGVLAGGACYVRFARVDELSRACDAGEARACTSHGFALAYGMGVPADRPVGVARSRRACEAGDAAGCTQAAVLARAWADVAWRCASGDQVACDAMGSPSARGARAALPERIRVAIDYAARRRLDLDASSQRQRLDDLLATCGEATCPFAHGARQFWALEHVFDQWKGLSLGDAPARAREILGQRTRRMRALEDNLGRLSRHPSPVFAQAAALRLAEAKEDFADALDHAGMEERRELELRAQATEAYAKIVEDAWAGATPRASFAVEAFGRLAKARGYYAAMPADDSFSAHH
ncbi:MAG: hypothetical protein AAGI01_07940 [Myxococcota bacterium]